MTPDSGKEFYCKYRAFVRDNTDPERLGRMRLEIPAVLGTGKDNWSEWASPCLPYGGNPDCGMFLIPEVGAGVWAEFEGGILQYPIWSGVWIAGSNPGEQPEESTRVCAEATCLDCEDAKHSRAESREHKKNHDHPNFYCPRRKVLLKTETGHTIVADDKDGEEFLKVIDRAGQIIQFFCPIKPELQDGNSLSRGTRDSSKGDQLEVENDVVNGKAGIEILDLSRQGVLLQAWHDEEKVILISCNAKRSRLQKIELDTTKGSEKIRLLGLNGGQEVLIDSSAGEEKIQLRDKAGSTITMDSVSGNILIQAAGKVLLN